MNDAIRVRKTGRWMIMAAIVLVLGFWAAQSLGPTKSGTAEKIGPALVESIEGTELSRVTLTERAAQRLDIQTGEVTDEQIAGATKRVIPYGAVFYDSMGTAWAYTNPEPLVYVRAELKIDRIEGDRAILAEGPDAGTRIVSVGAALLYGTEFGVGY